MLVTGVQAAGAKSVNALQGTVVDLKEANRLGLDAGRDRDRNGSTRTKAHAAEPVVFPRGDVGVDHRPASLRREHAAARYREDGGPPDAA